ncbi:flagellar biosynthetic protein FliO [Roseomonas sp. 18066]|uniref:flagellar biosynthetic protein FliO n=1 Tax=Roseomonas sp. 18066 TaxID=2681412 RepID=UPI00135833E6|nr:flagellar biosynthetic protein FliO [Roseomonas sp. 18066]
MNYQAAMTALAALILVLALVLLAARAARRFGFAPGVPGGLSGVARGQGRRLVLVESLALDTRRRLLLLRCDGRELLLVTGGPQDLFLNDLPRACAQDAG